VRGVDDNSQKHGQKADDRRGHDEKQGDEFSGFQWISRLNMVDVQLQGKIESSRLEIELVPAPVEAVGSLAHTVAADGHASGLDLRDDACADIRCVLGRDRGSATDPGHPPVSVG
jgi:hypothetical protein